MLVFGAAPNSTTCSEVISRIAKFDSAFESIIGFLIGVSRRSLWSPSLSSFGYRQIQGKNVPPYHPSNKATALQKLLWDPQPNHCVYNNPLNSLKMHFIQLVMVVSTLFAAR
jgi:hypothetical protein